MHIANNLISTTHQFDLPTPTLQKAQITKVVEIPSEHHGFVVGAAGKNVQRISAEFNVNIKFPKSSKKSRDSKVCGVTCVLVLDLIACM